MDEIRNDLQSLPFPFPKHWEDNRANCFNAVLAFLGHESRLQFCDSEEFVAAIQKQTRQIGRGEKHLPGDISIIWSRNDFSLPNGQIDVDRLHKTAPDYPFGLIIEHAFVHIAEDQVFQKRDPTANGPYEIVSPEEALSPYKDRHGLEVTFHRPNLGRF